MKLNFPIIFFLILVVILFFGLFTNTKVIQSPLIGKHLPNFALTKLRSSQVMSKDDLIKEPMLLNVWASWCITCRVEHGFLAKLSNQNIPITGINYKDEREDAIKWINKFGDPYKLIIHDYKGTFALDMGVTGAPETFLINNGEVLVHYRGEVNNMIWKDVFIPVITKYELFK
jgi:cytochrome c biogenesis protein CcmG/thiol:disulfide interchange protein DsbE